MMRTKTEADLDVTLEPSFAVKNLFDLIYWGAKRKRLEDIESALSHCSINVLSGLLGTPAYQLAFEGTKEAKDALDFLIKNYPKARFALLQQMAYGYAHGGHVDDANGVLNSAQSPANRLMFLMSMAHGYAQGGYLIDASKVLALANNPGERFALLGELVSGFAQVGNVEEVDKLLLSGTCYMECFELLGQASFHFAYGGHVNQVNDILALFKKEDEEDEKLDILLNVAYGYAVGGHITAINELLQLPLEHAALLIIHYYLLTGFAKGGHFDEVNEIMALGFSPDIVLWFSEAKAFAFAHSGYKSEANRVLLSYPYPERLSILTHVLDGYAQGSHVTEAMQVLMGDIDPKEHLNLFRQLANSYAKKGNVGEANKLLNLVIKPEERFQLLIELVSGYAAGNHFFEANAIVDLAAKPGERERLLRQIAMDIEESLFFNKDSALLILAVFNPSYQKKLAHELTETQTETAVNIGALVPKAMLLHDKLTKPTPLTRPVNFQYKLVLVGNWPQMQELLLMSGLDLVRRGKLNHNLLLFISTFLGPISIQEAGDLAKKLVERFRPTLFSHGGLIKDESLDVGRERCSKMSF